MMRFTVCAALAVLLLPGVVAAQQITLVDATINHTTSSTVYRALPGGFPADLTAPVDYAGGTLHHRVMVTATPGAATTSYQFCMLQTDRMPENRACSDYTDLQFNAVGTQTSSQTLASFSQAANLDLTAGLLEFALVILDADGNAIADSDANHMPLTATYQAVLVANGATFQGFPGEMPTTVANPTFSPAAGSYANSVRVTLASTTADANIFYTVDGSDPNMSSTAYTAPFTLTTTTTVRARAYKDALTPSAITSATYTITEATSGLTGRYYNGRSFATLTHTRVDPRIEFSWASGETPTPDTTATFSALWTGTLTPRYSEQFTFTTRADDGVRLWVNGQLLIDNWVDQGATTRTGMISLQADREYEVWMEYYNGGGAGEISLSWASPSQAEEIIPESALKPNAPATPATVTLLMDAQFDEIAETTTQPVVLEVRRRGALDASVRVNISYSGSAVRGEDFDGPTTVDIPAGQLFARIELTPILDGVAEGEENIVVSIAEGSGYVVGQPSEQEIAILDFDVNTFNIAGTINYAGTTSGKIFVEAFTDEMEEFEKRRVVLVDPGPFAILDVEEGDYNIVAFIDTNDNERLDEDEIWTMMEGKVAIPPSVTDITLTLSDEPMAPPTGGGSSSDGGCSSTRATPSTMLLFVLGFFVTRRMRRR